MITSVFVPPKKLAQENTPVESNLPNQPSISVEVLDGFQTPAETIEALLLPVLPPK